ncbi:hypothetical protein TNCV_196851 [Trichonephila clavipes]|uniref:Uncharacterized protein n=1 Tax=Trichonephila clavipes TaxID=2585209 RepID=A0A8X6WIP9_TRICX|nr:hypothetical protein TNCV_196851 [Trichonephila clavipes]
MKFKEINSRGKRGELLRRIDRQNSRFRTAKTIIIKLGLHASFVEVESAKKAFKETIQECTSFGIVFSTYNYQRLGILDYAIGARTLVSRRQIEVFQIGCTVSLAQLETGMPKRRPLNDYQNGQALADINKGKGIQEIARLLKDSRNQRITDKKK